MPKAGQKRKKKEGRKMSGVSRYAKVSPPFGRYHLDALAAHWRFAGGGARGLAPFENPFKTTLYDRRQAEYTLFA